MDDYCDFDWWVHRVAPVAAFAVAAGSTAGNSDDAHVLHSSRSPAEQADTVAVLDSLLPLSLLHR